MVELEKRLENQIDRLLEQAEQVDAQEDTRFGVGQRDEDLEQVPGGRLAYSRRRAAASGGIVSPARRAASKWTSASPSRPWAW